MKRFAFATVAALGLLAFSQEQATAWFSFSAGGSGNVSIACGGKNRCSSTEPWPTNNYGAPNFNNYGSAGGVPNCGYSQDCGGGYNYGCAYPWFGFNGGSVAPSSYMGLQTVPGYPQQAGFQPVGYYYGYGVPAYYGYPMPYPYGR